MVATTSIFLASQSTFVILIKGMLAKREGEIEKERERERERRKMYFLQ
jgi:hypothetical protein